MLCDPTWTEIFLSEYLFVYGHAFMFNRSKLTFNLMWQHCLSVILVIFILNYEIKYSVFPCCFIALERKWYFILKKINFKVCLKPLNNMNLFGTGEGAKHYPQYWKAHEINRRTKTKNRQSEGRSITVWVWLSWGKLYPFAWKFCFQELTFLFFVCYYLNMMLLKVL